VEVLHLRGRDHLITSSHNDRLVEVSEDELSRMCTWINEARVCDNLGAMAARPSDTCLGALFTGQMKAVTTHCNTAVSTRDWAVEKEAEGSYLVYLKSATLVRTTCTNGSVSSMTFKGYRRLPADAGCNLMSSDFSIGHSGASELRTSVALQLDWNIPELLEGQSVSAILDVRQELMAMSVRPEESVAALLDQAVAWSPEEDGLKEHLLSAASLLSLVVLSVIILFLCYRYKRQAAPAPDNHS
jgi:hypothetical protein